MSKTGFMKTVIDADEKNAKQNILIVTQGGIALEQKQYYLDTDEATVKIREGYKQNIVKMMQLFGFTEEQATQKMTNIMRLETEMAKETNECHGTEVCLHAGSGGRPARIHGRCRQARHHDDRR